MIIPLIQLFSPFTKNKRKSAEDAEPSSPKKRKVARKSRTTATKLTDTDNFDDYVDNMDLDASDDVSSQRLYSFPSALDLLLKAPKPSCSVLFAYCRSFCLAACREESSFDCSQIYESATPEGQPRRYCAKITFCFETLIS